MLIKKLIIKFTTQNNTTYIKSIISLSYEVKTKIMK